MENITRPQSAKRKIHSKDEFELCYLRHKYFRKTTANPSKEEMQPYYQIIKKQAKNTYRTYNNLFTSVGFYEEDLASIGTIHLVSYLGLFALEALDTRYYDFKVIFEKRTLKEPSQNDILDKNKANFTMFLKQRMEDVVRICRQKARNIKAMPTEEYYVFYGPKKPIKDLDKLVKNYEKMGYRKLDTASFKTIRKKAKEGMSTTFKFADNWYVCVPLHHRNLTLEDLSGADLSPYDNIHNMNPEQVFFHMEEARVFEDKKIEFNKSTNDSKMKLIKEFIENNKKNSYLKEEVKIAKKYLLSLED